MRDLEDILKFFAPRYRGRDVDDSGNALQCVGEIALDKVLNNSNFDLVAVLGVRLPQGVSLPRSRNPNEG